MNGQAYRGIGRTALMIETLPDEMCTVVVPSKDAGLYIDSRIKESGRERGTWRTVVIRRLGDHEKLGGLAVPVFFDHSFFEKTDELVALQAVNTARICSQMARWKKLSDKPTNQE